MPLLKIRNTRETPAGYWRFELPNGTLLYGGTLDDLVEKLHSFRINNNLDLGDPSAEIQDYLCRQTPGPKCVPANPAKPLPGVKASGGMVARFISAMIAWMKSDQAISQEEADERSELCGSCSFNAPIDDLACFGCFGILAKIAQVIGNRKTRLDSSLQHCSICGCSNAIQVWAPMDVLSRVHKFEDFPDNIGINDGNGVPVKCWKKQYADAQKRLT